MLGEQCSCASKNQRQSQRGLEASVQRMSEKGLDFDELRGKGVAMVEAAHQQAAQMEVAATDEIEKLSDTRRKGFG